MEASSEAVRLACVNGVELAYQIHGNGNPLVLLHGGFGSVEMFGPNVAALAAFVVPLYGTHGRLVDEKRRLEAEADTRLKGLIVELNRDIDTRKLTEIQPLHMALASMVQEREIVAKLSTWPWSTATARGFATAILFPRVLVIAQRVLAQLV